MFVHLLKSNSIEYHIEFKSNADWIKTGCTLDSDRSNNNEDVMDCSLLRVEQSNNNTSV